jgi:hypothetical protein
MPCATHRATCRPLAALDGVQPGLGGEFVAHVGTTMALAAAMPQDWFPKTGAPIAAVSPTVGLDRPEFFAKQNRPGPLVWSVKSGYCPRQMILDSRGRRHQSPRLSFRVDGQTGPRGRAAAARTPW